MADNKELKPKSFRITEETAEAFRKITEEIKGNQQVALAKLIETYELQRGKEVLQERTADIEQFENHVTALTRMYMGVLEDSQQLTQTIRMEFAAQLQLKDTTIQNLNDQLNDAKKAKTEAEENVKSCKNLLYSKMDEVEALTKQIESLNNALADKDALNSILTDTCSTLKGQIEQGKLAQEQLSEVKNELQQIKATNATLEKNLADQEQKATEASTKAQQQIDAMAEAQQQAIEQMKERLTLEFEREKLALERRHHEEMQALTAVQNEAIVELQKRYSELITPKSV